ncbi:methyltransferase domain-containing protein [Arthrobacter sp. Sa2BUA2]|uniref:Methyltransferase domain-containing protein n=1 Tax=Arthrobacter pullicola TaxID=2762224 RepID=A0ABR8YH65_9MICC|nr:methyltransferase domain-containing protein [Arthrobacter pullicola]MBD8043555.1 methyltransferase domain-containing protein [Arthrobacter pullicola]
MTSQHSQKPHHGHHDSHQQGHQFSGHSSHQHDDESGLAEVLDLDALLLRDHLQEIFEWTAAHQPNPATILDLGAGTGTGTLGLTRTFPAAQVTAVDQSEFMLQRLAAMMENQRLSARVSTLQADLDTGWPQLSGIDLAWAASSMHHMGDPAHIFDQIARTLTPEGLLVVVEMDTLPRYLPDDLGFGTPGLEQRCHNAVAAAGWNSHPDWATAIRDAGMVIAGQRTFVYATDDNRDLIARNAQAFLSRMRTGLEDTLSQEDLATLDQLLDPDGPQSLGRRTDLTMRGSRTAWAARPGH